jgi:ankyrin repeat protein
VLLLRAAAEADLQMVKVLVDIGADVNCCDVEGYTPLHFACRAGAPEVCLALLQAGACADSRSARGQTPLHLATLAGRKCGELVALLQRHLVPSSSEG